VFDIVQSGAIIHIVWTIDCVFDIVQSGAIHVVRTIGRVFDVCHRLNHQKASAEFSAPCEQKKPVQFSREPDFVKGNC